MSRKLGLLLFHALKGLGPLVVLQFVLFSKKARKKKKVETTDATEHVCVCVWVCTHESFCVVVVVADVVMDKRGGGAQLRWAGKKTNDFIKVIQRPEVAPDVFCREPRLEAQQLHVHHCHVDVPVHTCPKCQRKAHREKERERVCVCVCVCACVCERENEREAHSQAKGRMGPPYLQADVPSWR